MRHPQGFGFFDFLVRDQEVEGSNPFAPTPSIGLILTILREKTFPMRMSAQLDYLADSIAGRSIVSPRRSRDICGKARAEERRSSRYRIIRYEYYIECTCGYKVPARDSACRKCGTPIPLFKELLWGTGFA